MSESSDLWYQPFVANGVKAIRTNIANVQGGLSMIFCLAQNLQSSRMPSCALLPVILLTCSLFGNAQLN